MSSIVNNVLSSSHAKTGPKTAAAKQRVRLNALRHGLTGQTVLLPTDDLEAYRTFCRRYHHEFQPVGIVEEQSVQTLADTQWRLNRVRSTESTILAIDSLAEPGVGVSMEESNEASLADSSAAIELALSVERKQKTLLNLSLYEQRLSRLYTRTVSDLQRMQVDRKTQEAVAQRKAQHEAKLLPSAASATSRIDFSSSVKDFFASTPLAFQRPLQASPSTQQPIALAALRDKLVDK